MSTSNDLYASASFSFDADKAGGSFSGHNSTDEDLPNAFGDFVHNNRVDDQDEIAAKQESRKVRFWRNTILSLVSSNHKKWKRNTYMESQLARIFISQIS